MFIASQIEQQEKILLILMEVETVDDERVGSVPSDEILNC